MQKKAVARVRVKDADQGIVEAVFASHLITQAELKTAPADVIDKDGDVTLKGAFTAGQAVVISAYGHKSWEGKLPVGKGVIREEGDLAICEMQFFMDTTHGRDTFAVVKELGADDLQEWSYSLDNVKSSRATVAGRSIRVLEQVALVKEVSPVLMGAGVDTRNLATKAARKQLDSTLRGLLRTAGQERFSLTADWVYVEAYDVDEEYVVFCLWNYDKGVERLVRVDFTRTDTTVTLGDAEVEVIETEVYLPKSADRLPFSEHATAVLAAVDELHARASEVVALRAEKGKRLSSASAEVLARLADRTDSVKALLAPSTPDNPTEADDRLQAEFLKFVAFSTQGV
jgi:hypothetical protein